MPLTVYTIFRPSHYAELTKTNPLLALLDKVNGGVAAQEYLWSSCAAVPSSERYAEHTEPVTSRCANPNTNPNTNTNSAQTHSLLTLLRAGVQTNASAHSYPRPDQIPAPIGSPPLSDPFLEQVCGVLFALCFLLVRELLYPIVTIFYMMPGDDARW